MMCTRPTYINIIGEVPCGKCMACRIRKTSEWASRLSHEKIYWNRAVFATLTYNNENLPETLVKKHLQLFFKRMRQYVDLKYYAVGEYGERNKRPHYHAIIFGVGRNQDGQSLVDSCWDNGFVYLGAFNQLTCKYVSGYVQKKLSGSMAVAEYGINGVRPFQICSQGIGKRFVLDNVNYLLSKMGFSEGGIEKSLPRYYLKVLGDLVDPEWLDALRFKREDEWNDIYVKNNIFDDEAKRNFRKLLCQKHELELQFRAQNILSKRNKI